MNNGSLASQLNKLSLDNNLTDIDEEEDENFSRFGKDQDSNQRILSQDISVIQEVTSNEVSIDLSTVKHMNPGSNKIEEDGCGSSSQRFSSMNNAELSRGDALHSQGSSG